MNPSDNADPSAKVIKKVRNKDEQLFLNSDHRTLQSRKAIRKELRKQRHNNDDPSSADFQGPWAIYDGMQ